MGIQGFAKFINDRAQTYFENYQLHDCNLIIDGHSLSCQLYNWKHWQFDARSNNCYGGDYDKYVYIVENFFGMLKEAKVRPIVVFDGGFEQRKLPTILRRMQDKIVVASKLDPVTEVKQPGDIVFPLFLREAFKDVLRSLDVQMLMCQYEGDTEIASISKRLNCPVVTFDSDYFLFGVQYIPFKTVASKVTAVENWRTGSYKYISCKMFKIDKLLGSFPGLNLNTLHLLPVLLGNDYIDCILFKGFLQSINVCDCTIQEKILKVLNWLKTVTPKVAIQKILATFDNSEQRVFVLNKIEKIVSSYYLIEGRLFKYIKIACDSKIKSEKKIDFTELKNDLKNLPLTSNNNEDTPVSSKAEPTKPREDQFNFKETHLEKENASENTVSKLFLKNYTKAEYPSSFMDILTQNRYYCIPQVEDFDDNNCHQISFSILSAIHKILTDSKGTNFTIVGRTEGTKVESLVQEAFTMSVPSLKEIEQLPLQGRREVLFKILTIDDAFLSTLSKFPTEWHTFLISLKYTTSKISLQTPLIYSLVIVFIILNYIDQRIGYYRSVDRYKQKFNSFMQKVHPIQDNIPFRVDKNCFYYFLTHDCIVFMQKVMHLFTLNPKESPLNFDKKLIHQMAQIQSVLLHIKYLNALLKFPYPNLIVHQVLDCTFIYNLAKILKEKSDDSQYLNNFLEDCPTVLSGLNYVLDSLTKEGILCSEDNLVKCMLS